MRKAFVLLTWMFVCAGMAGCDSEKPLSSNPTERAIQERRAHFKVIGEAFKSIDDELKASTPDLPKIQEAVKKIAAVGVDIPKWFPAGTGPESGFETAAKAEVWSDGAQFDKAYDAFMLEANRLLAAASVDNVADLTSQFYTTGVACANCHKPFRVKKD